MKKIVVEMEGSQRRSAIYVIRAPKEDNQKCNPRKHFGHK